MSPPTKANDQSLLHEHQTNQLAQAERLLHNFESDVQQATGHLADLFMLMMLKQVEIMHEIRQVQETLANPPECGLYPFSQPDAHRGSPQSPSNARERPPE